MSSVDDKLPDGWEETTLNKVIELVGGGTPRTKIDEYWNGNIPWLSVVDFNDDNRWVSNTEKTITELGLKKSSTKLLNKGDLIISARGTVGALAQLKCPMSFNQSCYGIREMEDVSNVDFLFYLVKYSLQQISRNVHGAVFDTITRQTFDFIDIVFPSDIKEQKAIAKVLTSFDDKIENLRAQNQTLEQTAQTIFKEWFGKYQIGDDLSEGWRVGKIIELFEVRDGTHDSPKQCEKGKLLITSKHITKERIKFEEAYLISNEDFISINKRSVVEQYDILFSMIGTLGLTYLEQNSEIDYAIKNLALFKTSQNRDWAIYTYLWLTSKNGKHYVIKNKGGSTQQFMSLSSLRDIEFVMPRKKVIRI